MKITFKEIEQFAKTIQNGWLKIKIKNGTIKELLFEKRVDQVSEEKKDK